MDMITNCIGSRSGTWFFSLFNYGSSSLGNSRSELSL